MRVLPLLLLGLASAAAADGGGCPPDAERALRLLNALRAEAHACGGRLWPAAPALRRQPLLEAAALQQARVLARNDRIDHAGPPLRTRLREAGYALRVAGENLAGGPETVDEALSRWLASPAHCANLMAADFEDAGLACVSGPGELQRYWVLQMGAARSSPGR
ncbi:MAG: CAP domain-containing protein [Roseateles sp.]|uniref:CAP domain-containing protein n=1 Tax=Roseateles sp. TaxID=1971397 RepID=UPI0039E8652B